MDDRHIPSVADYAAQAKRYEQAGDGQAAMRSYLIATHLQMLQLAPNDAAACFQLGMAFGQAGEEASAQAAFRAALSRCVTPWLLRPIGPTITPISPMCCSIKGN
jgi:hypothetical protein